MRASCLSAFLALAPSTALPQTFVDFIDELREFTGDAQLSFSEEADAAALIADRIIAGFEQYPFRQLTLGDGVTIYWGWQHGQAFIRSIAIRSAAGHLQLVGAIDHIPLLYSSRSNRAITDKQSYQSLLSRRSRVGDILEVKLFTVNADVLALHYPLVRRWLQAAMLGFNADCNDSQQAPVCSFVEQVDLPITAYALQCDTTATVNDCALAVPEVQAASISLELFRQ